MQAEAQAGAQVEAQAGAQVEVQAEAQVEAQADVEIEVGVEAQTDMEEAKTHKKEDMECTVIHCIEANNMVLRLLE
jgi:uncharacterized protein YggE